MLPFIFILGAMIGSFLNVCIYRLPRGLSIVVPPSHCPSCGKTIPWYDNIPILSYFLLNGRCRFCRLRISPRYLIVEILTASLLAALVARFGPTPKFLAYSIMSCGLITATFVDLEIQEIPDEVSLGLLAVGLILSLILPSVLDASSWFGGILNSALGALAGGVSIYLMGFFGELVFKREAMGGGDVKLMAMAGAFLGWEKVLLAFFLAPLFGSVVGIILKIKEGREVIPYGPYLSLAVLVSIFFGEWILRLLLCGMY